MTAPVPLHSTFTSPPCPRSAPIRPRPERTTAPTRPRPCSKSPSTAAVRASRRSSVTCGRWLKPPPPPLQPSMRCHQSTAGGCMSGRSGSSGRQPPHRPRRARQPPLRRPRRPSWQLPPVARTRRAPQPRPEGSGPPGACSCWGRGWSRPRRWSIYPGCLQTPSSLSLPSPARLKPWPRAWEGATCTGRRSA